jgi:gliding motility-associated-like protein
MSLRSLRCCLLLMVMLAQVTTWSQLAAVPITVETEVHYGDYGDGVDLTGFVTYKVYVNFINEENYLTALFGAEAQPDCVQDTDSTLFMHFDCDLFQHEAEGAYGYNQSCFYDFDLFPSSLYDSWLTIGKTCGATPTCDIIGSLGSCGSWVLNFEGATNGDQFDGGDFFWDEYSLYSIPCNVNIGSNVSLSYAGSDNRVLIGQFTTCGNMNGCINLTYRTQAMIDAGGGNSAVALDVCFEAFHPCLTNLMDTQPTILEASCFGDNIGVELDASGNGPVDYTVHYANGLDVVANYDNQNGLLIPSLNAGEYVISMIDSTGCRDTTSAFVLVDPIPLQLTAERLSDVLCFGESTGSISINGSGGTGDLTLTVNNQEFAEVVTLPGLGCGNYDILLEDEEGCSADTIIAVSCPAPLAFDPTITNIECFGYDDGSILGNMLGGTGELDFEWLYNSSAYADSVGEGPLDVGISGLDSGTYSFYVVDENGCELEGDFEITEPGEFIATPTLVDATCFSFCDGEVVFEIIGGTPPTALAVSTNGSAANPGALCAGEYVYVITDDNNCTVSGNFEIAEQPEITFESAVTPVTCFADCDGAIELNNVAGGYEGFTYNLTPNSALCAEPCTGNNVAYENVCAGTYSILITDMEGCLKTVTGLVIETPGPLQMILDVNDVSCFGFANGYVNITANGGTSPIILTPGDIEIPALVEDLGPGTYEFTITDDNGCFDVEDVIIEEPELLVATLTTINEPSCGGACDGSILYEVTGGTVPYVFLLNPTGQNGVTTGVINSLCALEYELVVSDVLNCIDTMEFEILEPEPLGIDFVLDAPTCTGMSDGSAVLNLLGGTGPLTLFFEPITIDTDMIDDTTYQQFNLEEGSIAYLLMDSVDCIYLDTLQIVPDIITDMILTGFSSPESCWNTNDGTATMAVQNGNVPISYEWNDDLEQVTAVATGLEGSQTYVVVVTDAIGCTLSSEVYVEPTEGCFFISTAVTPNGDGDNDFWLLGGLEYYPSAIVQVFNRWGQTVFESKGYSAPWNGTFQGQALPVADYYFVIEYAEDKDPIMGTVTIKY